MDFQSAVQFGERGRGVYHRVRGLPPWARTLVFLAALPGIVLALLSIVVFIVSILALFLLTIPVYRTLALLTGAGGESRSEQETTTVDPSGERVGRRQVNVRVIE